MSPIKNMCVCVCVCVCERIQTHFITELLPIQKLLKLFKLFHSIFISDFK